jgi:hypothetical protein
VLLVSSSVDIGGVEFEILARWYLKYVEGNYVNNVQRGLAAQLNNAFLLPAAVFENTSNFQVP